MLTTGVDPFTQVYQVVANAMRQYPGLVKNEVGDGNGLFRTLLDMTAPNFQQTLKAMGAGDSPGLRLGQDVPLLMPYGRNSVIGNWDQNIHFMFTTDTLNLVTLNELIFLFFCALCQLPQDLGLTGMVEKWVMTNSQARFVQPVNAENDATGSLRWSYAVTMKVSCYLNSKTLQGMTPTVV